MATHSRGSLAALSGALLGAVVFSACGGDDGGKKDESDEEGDASAASAGGKGNGGKTSMAGRNGAGGVVGAAGAGAGGGPLPVVCGDTTCTPPNESGGLQAYACCTEEGVCGVRVPLTTRCLGFKMPGKVDPVCPGFQQGDRVTLTGCCSPIGCGAYATFENVGCIPNEDLGRPHLACDFDRDGKPDGVDAAAPPGDGAAPKDAAPSD